MTGEEFKKIVEYYGEQNIIGLGFDNSAGKTFQSGQFTLANCYVEEIECIRQIEFDNKGLPYHVIKPVDTIQCIMVRDSGVDADAYDMVSVRG